MTSLFKYITQHNSVMGDDSCGRFALSGRFLTPVGFGAVFTERFVQYAIETLGFGGSYAWTQAQVLLTGQENIFKRLEVGEQSRRIRFVHRFD